MFPDTELYRMEQEGQFIPAGEEERLQQVMDTVSGAEMVEYRRSLKSLERV